MAENTFKVGDRVMYVGDGVEPKIITILRIEGRKYWNDYHSSYETYCTIEDLRKLTKLEKALS